MRNFKLPNSLTKIDRLMTIGGGLRIFKKHHRPWTSPVTLTRRDPGIFIGQTNIIIVGRIPGKMFNRFYFDDLK